MTYALANQARCLRCGYQLFGLAESRCPECGSTFDLNDPKTFGMGAWGLPGPGLALKVHHFAKRLAETSLVVARSLAKLCRPAVPAAIVWLAFYLSGLYAFAVLFAVTVALVVRRRWLQLGVLALTAPPLVVIFTYASQYAFSQYPYVMPLAYRGYEGGVDPESRCFRYDGGICGTRGSDAWIELRWTLKRPVERWMNRLFGPPPRAYNGPYPTEVDAIAAVRAGGIVRIDPMHEQFILPNGTRVSMRDYRQAGAYINCIGRANPDVEPVHGTIVGGRCAILRVPTDTRTSGQPARVVLIDLMDSSQFALYFDPTPLPTTAGSNASLRPFHR